MYTPKFAFALLCSNLRLMLRTFGGWPPSETTNTCSGQKLRPLLSARYTHPTYKSRHRLGLDKSHHQL